MSRFTAWDVDAARALVQGMGRAQADVLPMLHALQARFGFVHADAVRLVAEAVNASRAEVHGVVTFYHDFRTAPPAGRVIRLCRAEACQAVGCEALVAEAARLGLPVDQGGGEVAIETVYCLGNCALGPAALVDGVLVGLLDAARLRALVAGGAAVREPMA
jgi:formate dehydrogenase subunit gamma